MRKKICLFTFILLLIFNIPYAYAIELHRSDFILTNNTPEKMDVKVKLTTKDSNFTKGKDWDESSITLLPYESKPVLWFRRNLHVKHNVVYRFDVTANHPSYPGKEIVLTFVMIGQRIGSTVTADVTCPDKIPKQLYQRTGLEHFSESLWGCRYDIYARSWLDLNRLFDSYHFVISKPQKIFFDTANLKQISVLTYNVQLLPFYGSVSANLNHPKVRAVDIPKKIKQYDVVIFEELYEKSLRESIIRGMFDNYPYYTNVVGNHTSKILTGGVIIFSKWPILKQDQMVYKDGNGTDALSAKGAAYAEINKNGKIYHIFGTHLQSASESVDIYIRQKQLKELADFINQEGIPADQPALIGGDFNVDEFSEEIPNLTSILSVVTVDNIGYGYSYDPWINTMNIGVHRDRSRLDYVFFSRFHEQPRIALNKVFVLRELEDETMWPKFDLSDHFPTVGYFDFRKEEDYVPNIK